MYVCVFVFVLYLADCGLCDLLIVRVGNSYRVGVCLCYSIQILALRLPRAGLCCWAESYIVLIREDLSH